MFQHEWDQDSINFPLDGNSVVFEVGGYQGRWAAEIAKRYNPHLFVFEPQDWAYKNCAEALKEYPKVKVLPYALGAVNARLTMQDWGTDGCSFTKEPIGKPTGEAEMREIRKVLAEERISHIDLMLMNIEGYELTLIPHMLKNHVFGHIRYFMCQFHVNGEEEEQHYWQIRDELGRKMLIRFNYGKVLTCWEAL